MRVRSKLIKALILGVSVLAIAGTAQAGTTNINVYGASAQFNYWSAMASTFLQAPVASGGLGCGAPAKTTCSVSGSTIAYGGKAEVVCAPNCAAMGGAGNTVCIHYTAKASYDGPQALTESWGKATNHVGDSYCDTTAHGGGGGGTGPWQRLFCQSGGTLSCDTVNVGACDVDASEFLQNTNGTLFGPMDTYPTNSTIRSFPANGLAVPNLNTPDTPIAVPFAFYVNPGVKVRTCKAGTPRANAVTGGTVYCSDDMQCGNATCSGGANAGQTCLNNHECLSGVCNGAPAGDCQAATQLTNLSRLQAVMLFSGQIANWKQFGLAFPDLPVTLCMRHAGSGTHATLDLSVMEGKGWGAAPAAFESRADQSPGTYPYIYFTDGSGDLKNCMQWANGTTTDNAGNILSHYDHLAASGAVGVLDADTGSTANYIQVAYNGVWPSRVSIRNGDYDDFWSLQRVYTASVGSGYHGTLAQGANSQQTVYNAMIPFMKNGSNLTIYGNGTVAAAGAIANFYATADELNFNKATNTDYPGFTGPGAPADASGNQLPYAP